MPWYFCSFDCFIDIILYLNLTVGPLAGFLTDNIRNGPFLAIFVGTIIGGLGYVWTCYANSVIEVIMAQGFLIGETLLL